jgi:hypothetical protein
MDLSPTHTTVKGTLCTLTTFHLKDLLKAVTTDNVGTGVNNDLSYFLIAVFRPSSQGSLSDGLPSR